MKECVGCKKHIDKERLYCPYCGCRQNWEDLDYITRRGGAMCDLLLLFRFSSSFAATIVFATSYSSLNLYIYWYDIMFYPYVT